MNDHKITSNGLSFTDKLEKLNTLSSDNIDALLYDCDGTLADSMPGHKKAYVQVAAKAGVVLDDRIIDEFAGLPVPKVVEEINKRYGSDFHPVQFAEERERIFLNDIISFVQPVDFVVAHMKANHGKKRIAVVSGSERSTVEKTLQVIGIADIPELLVCAGETPHGKPYPDPFLAAAAQLGVAPERCLVFEDSESGVKAAIAAGMKWVRIDHL